MAYFPADDYPYSGPSDYVDYGSKFVCGPTCCTVVPTAPAHGVGVYDYERRGDYGGYGGYGRSPACNGVLRDGIGFGGRQRGPAGWVEVGYVVSVEQRRRRPREKHEYNVSNRATRGRVGGHSNGTSVSRRASFAPRRQFRSENGQRRSDDDDQEEEGEDYAGEERRCHGDCGCFSSSSLQVQCRVRRYRLYARPAYGWCGSYNVSQWQYAVTEEGVPRCDAIFIVLRDNPRGRRRGGFNRSLSWQQLQSGELIRIPGEPTPFRVHLYEDDYHY